MQKDFAIICAANINKRNSGMYSVDLAAQHYFSKLGRSYDLCMTQGDSEVGNLRFRKLRTPEDLRDYKNIVYWGDFQNNPLWGANDYSDKEIAYEGVASREDAFSNWANRYLLLHRHIGSDARVSPSAEASWGPGNIYPTLLSASPFWIFCHPPNGSSCVTPLPIDS